MGKIFNTVLLTAALTGGCAVIPAGTAYAKPETGTEALKESYAKPETGTEALKESYAEPESGTAAPGSEEAQPMEISGETDYNAAQDSGEESEEAFGKCFAGSDIPMPEAFFEITAQDAVDSWENAGEATYTFYNPYGDETAEKQDNIGYGENSVDASSCIEKINRYLTGRGYGREAAALNEKNGRTEIVWYKGSCRVKIAALTNDNFAFTALFRPEDKTQAETLIGKWEGYAERQGENYIMTLDFMEDGQVEYMTGWVQSEAAFLSTGTYTVEEDSLHLSFPYDQISGQQVNWDCTYRFEITDDTLRMEYISGDSLNIFQGVGAVFDYSRSADESSGKDVQTASEEFILTEEDKERLCRHLRVPDTAAVEVQIGEEYFWEAAGAEVVPISVYENGKYVAGADISKETKELMTSILTYQPPQ